MYFDQMTARSRCAMRRVYRRARCFGGPDYARQFMTDFETALDRGEQSALNTLWWFLENPQQRAA